MEEDLILQQIQQALEQLVLGKSPAPLSTDGVIPQLDQIAELINILNSSICQTNAFIAHIARGDLTEEPPSHRGYVSPVLYELYSQLQSFAANVQQLRTTGEHSIQNTESTLVDTLDWSLRNMSTPTASRQQWKNRHLTSALNHMSIMVVQVAADGSVTLINRAAKAKLGNLVQLDLEGDTSRTSPILDAIVSFSHYANPFPAYKEIYDSADGNWYKLTSNQLRLPNGQPAYLHIVDDISEWKINQEKLKISATIDPLTEVFNRKVGTSALKKILSNPKRTTPCCASFIDIDNLKKINDTYGHSEGDYTIRSIAEVLMSSVRGADIVSRYGGDEFLLVFTGCDIDNAERVIERMYQKLNKINLIHEKPYNLSMSHGSVQINPDTQITVRELILLMDKKMYERKNAKKNLPPNF